MQEEISTFNEIPTRIFPCDIDGDGNQDLLAGTKGENGMNKRLMWYKNEDGTGDYQEAQIIDFTQETAWSIKATDMDGDGDLDVVAALNEDRIVWYENINGKGSFGEAQLITKLYSDVFDIHVFDADNDGDIDFFRFFSVS